MSQSDMNLANLPFASARADLNNIFSALASNSSGSSDPSTTFPGQLFNDTANNVLKLRNDANNAWIELAFLDQSTNEWQVRTGAIQAVDSDGLQIKTDDGTTRLTISDSGDATFTGTIQTPNITDGTDTVETGYVLNGSAKVWVNYQTAESANIRESFNVSNLTDEGTGLATVGFTSNMNTSTYSVPSGGGNGRAGGDNTFTIGAGDSAGGAPSTSDIHLNSHTQFGTLADCRDGCIAIFGDLA